MEQNLQPPANADLTAPPPPTEIDISQASVSLRYDDVYQQVAPDEVAEVLWKDGAYQFNCHNRVALRVQVVTPGIIRLRYSPDGVFERDFSYAVDPGFRPPKVVATLNETDSEYLLVSEQLQVVVQKADLRVKFYDLDDRTLCEDAAGFSAKRTVLKGWCDLRMSKICHRRELFLGLGDKACGTNLRGKKFENWCEDAFAFGRQTDPMYRAIPFYFAVNQGIAYGIFFDNSFRTHFDFDSQNTGATSFWAEGGELNYYFISGPTLEDVCRHYATLTGKPELPPMWALGYHQCRWSYYPHSRVLEIAQRFRDLKIPCDAIYLDIDYMDGYRCFTWNYEHFPDPRGLVEELQKTGFQTVVMIDPGIKEDPDYAVYREGMAENFFVRTADGAVAKAPVWPGFCAFPDFTDPAVREWWGGLYEDLYNNIGVAGFWNDMNEPAVFHVHHKTLPDNVLHDHDGLLCSHRKAHNVYGLLMTRASHEGYKRLQPDRRPYLLTRATFAGGQRYAAVWTGDNCSDWEHLQIANIQCQRLAVSGFSFCGTDIGGFAGEVEPELFVRWLQLAVFHPLMRVHSMGQHASGDGPTADAEAEIVVTDEAQLTDPALHRSDQEPWSFGEKWTPLAKKAIELRYALLPCLYTAMWRAATDGSPALRHLVFADPTDPRLAEIERDFLFGEHLLVSPVVQPKVQRQMVYLPKGNWYYFWSGQVCSAETYVTVQAEQIPFFVREGAVLPTYPVRQWTGEKPVDELTLYVYFKNGLETSHLYEDLGEGYRHEDGHFSLKTYTTEGSPTTFSLRQEKQGEWQPTYSRIKIFVIGLPFFAKNCHADGAEMPIKEIRLRERSLYTLVVPPDFEAIKWEA